MATRRRHALVAIRFVLAVLAVAVLTVFTWRNLQSSEHEKRADRVR
jgi:hypothetical protein